MAITKYQFIWNKRIDHKHDNLETKGEKCNIKFLKCVHIS